MTHKAYIDEYDICKTILAIWVVSCCYKNIAQFNAMKNERQKDYGCHPDSWIYIGNWVANNFTFQRAVGS